MLQWYLFLNLLLIGRKFLVLSQLSLKVLKKNKCLFFVYIFIFMFDINTKLNYQKEANDNIFTNMEFNYKGIL